MVTARFFMGASLWALLVVDICCGPVKRFNPGASSRGAAASPRPRSNPGAPSRLHSPGHGPEGAYPEEAAAPPPMFELEPEPVLSTGSGSSPRPVQSRGSAGRRKPAGPAQAGAGVQAAPEAKWLIQPSIFEETPEVESSSDLVMRRAPPPEYEEAPELESFVRVSPPQPEYQAGELSHYQKTSEMGNYESEIEEQGLLPPPPEPMYPLPVRLDESTSEGFVSKPQPPLPPAGLWFFYPYYDYRFLAGNYPVGTYSHFSSSFEQGHDNNEEAHYLAPSQPVNTPLEVEPPQTTEALRAPAKSGPKRGAAAAQSSSLRGAKQATYGGYAYWR